MASPRVALEHILQHATKTGADDAGRYTIGTINAAFLRDGFTPDDWRAGIAHGNKTGALIMHKSGSFFTKPEGWTRRVLRPRRAPE